MEDRKHADDSQGLGFFSNGTDLEAVALTDDPAGLARAIELIEMAQKRIAPGAFPGRSASGCRACCRRIQIPRTGSTGFANWWPRRNRRVQTSASPYRTISRTSGSSGRRLPSEPGAGATSWIDGSIGGTTTFWSQDDALCQSFSAARPTEIAASLGPTEWIGTVKPKVIGITRPAVSCQDVP